MSDWLGMKRHTVGRNWPRLLMAITAIVLSGCSGVSLANDNVVPSIQEKRASLAVSGAANNVAVIELGDTTTLHGSGATVSGSTVTITASGRYSISGTLDDGQILVNTKDKNTVELILNGVSIASSTSAPIYALDVKTMVIVLADGTENYVADGDSYVIRDSESDEPNAAIFSKGDLTITGDGSLKVDAHYAHGIASKDKLNITRGNITVNSVSDGIRGRDCIVVRDGNLTVNAGADGMQSNNDEDSTKGFVAIEGGDINITAGGDGIQAETRVAISGGNTAISSGGGSANSSRLSTTSSWGMRNPSQKSASAISSKGIKAVVDVTVEGGTIRIDSADDSIHSNDSLTIKGGDIVLVSGDDGIHADSTVEINGGDISLTKCYEGLESAVVTINAGNIYVVSSDDGINVVDAGANDDPPIGGRPVPNALNSSASNYLSVKGGYVVIDAAGDGLDINGSIAMTGGAVVVNGPIVNNDGAVDYDRGFKITGGTLVAVGSSGMAQAPDTTSTQYSVMYNFPSVQPAGTMVHIETTEGQEILTFLPTKAYQSLVLSSSELRNGSTYNIYTGGSSTGMVTDGLYSGGRYIPGTRATSITISSIVTAAGPRGGFPAPGGGRR